MACYNPSQELGQKVSDSILGRIEFCRTKKKEFYSCGPFMCHVWASILHNNQDSHPSTGSHFNFRAPLLLNQHISFLRFYHYWTKGIVSYKVSVKYSRIKVSSLPQHLVSQIHWLICGKQSELGLANGIIRFPIKKIYLYIYICKYIRYICKYI